MIAATPLHSVPPYPLPPQVYIAAYTDENIHRGKAPPPPPLPRKGGEPFHVFGAPQWNDDNIVRPFDTPAIRRLYGVSFDRKRELKKVLHSILISFLDLIDVLVRCPYSHKRNEKLEDMNLLFIHFQHLVNEYRVHQARDGVRVMLELQKRQTLDVTDRLNLHVDKASEMVAIGLGTANQDHVQTQLNSSLQYLSQLQAKQVDLLSTATSTGDHDDLPANGAKSSYRLFDQFMCDLISQEQEETAEKNDWMTTDEVMDVNSVHTDDFRASTSEVDRT